MLLAIDVGNTNTVLGCFWNGTLKRTWRVSTHPICTADEFKIKLAALFKLEGLEMQAFDSVLVSSVVPSYTAMLRSAFQESPLHVINHQSPFSFTIKANPASQVGADRLVNAEAALQEYGAPCIIVDSGTATTLCALSPNKEYLGGAILPGIELSIETLARKTAQLFTIELVVPEKAIGANTQEALRSGILLGYAEMIDGMVRRFKKELGRSDAPVVATGGISVWLKGVAQELQHFDKDLTLKGIASIYESLRCRQFTAYTHRQENLARHQRQYCCIQSA
jgi:type III pantothenate kinase